MNKKDAIALVRNDIKKHQDGEIDEMPTVSQYAKKAEMTIKDLANHLRGGLNAEEQAYYYNHENNNED